MFFVRSLIPFFNAMITRLGGVLVAGSIIAWVTGRKPRPEQESASKKIGRVAFLALLLILLFVLLLKL